MLRVKFIPVYGFGCLQKKNKKVNHDGGGGGSEKKNNNDVHPNEEPNQKREEEQKKDNNGGGGGGGSGGGAVLLKTELHCEGCANKVYKFLRGFSGVENVTFDEGASGKIKVFGKVDPVEIREKLEQKTHKKVELLSPVPKKDNNKEIAKAKDGGDGKNSDGKGDKKKDDSNDKDHKNNKKGGKDEKTPKQPPVSTAVMKVPLHCEGCILKIHKIISKTKGYEEVKIEKEKDLITVRGAMDMKALAENLKKHLKRNVEIVPPKKDEKKEKGNGGGEGGGGENGGDKVEGNKMQVQQVGQQQQQFGGYGMAALQQQQPAYGYPSPSPYMYGGGGGPAYLVGDPYAHFPYHAPQMFSDENPNACSIM
ncbi:OLC1v1003798C1 [Oldenlandia corymbosa var. corymbosa]|uniref:OLC1v1003798C1 n=1 Tax=Oldenlandia corymbosa var. corymbosa TaxID=529605 RepID=A0AAV1DB00_OLDCO|nr:OLC1v1003798C1 [Oldenlandia corymbosa var. corymbosa]